MTRLLRSVGAGVALSALILPVSVRAQAPVTLPSQVNNQAFPAPRTLPAALPPGSSSDAGAHRTTTYTVAPPPPPPIPPIVPQNVSAANIPFHILNDALALSPEQSTQVKDLQGKGQTQWVTKSVSNSSRKALQAQVDAADAAIAAQIVDILSDEQKHSLALLVDKLSILGADTFPDALAAQLDVNEDQLQQIKAINDASTANLQLQKKQFQGSEVPTNQLYRTEFLVMRALIRKRVAAVLDILTPAQRTAIDSFAQQYPGFGRIWSIEHETETPAATAASPGS